MRGELERGREQLLMPSGAAWGLLVVGLVYTKKWRLIRSSGV